jgi:Protein of unknown function (DUF1194)
MHRRALLAAGAAAAATMGAAARFAPARASEEPVDVLLVLAVDVSRSVDEDEARLQREGYRNAVSDPLVVEAIRGGMIGAVGIAYVEWAGAEYQRLVLPWTRISTSGDAFAWATRLDEAPRASLSWTSISGALDFSGRVLAEAPFEGTRRVIDVSGDGVNNSGGPVEAARDKLLADGVTINGLPIMNDRPTFGRLPPVPLDEYFRESVVGGPGAFVIPAEDFQAFGHAVKRKLIREIAGTDIGPRFFG